jgi:DnaJ-class molecular chaperone
MAMKHHPDRGGNATEFHKIKTAYNSLNGNHEKMIFRG